MELLPTGSCSMEKVSTDLAEAITSKKNCEIVENKYLSCFNEKKSVYGLKLLQKQTFMSPGNISVDI